MAEIELGTADGSDEIKVYDEVQDYLASGRYPETATKVEKGVIRKRAKKFLLVDGVLHYKQSVKGGEQRLRQVRVNNLHCHGRIQGERSYLIMHCVTMYYLSSMSGYQRQSDQDKNIGSLP